MGLQALVKVFISEESAESSGHQVSVGSTALPVDVITRPPHQTFTSSWEAGSLSASTLSWQETCFYLPPRCWCCSPPYSLRPWAGGPGPGAAVNTTYLSAGYQSLLSDETLPLTKT